MSVRCEFTPAPCHTPTRCDACRHFKRASRITPMGWVCPACAEKNTFALKGYYTTGVCPTCNEYSNVLIAHVINLAQTATRVEILA